MALDVATAVLPTYRSRFSKHQFTQPQLLAVLCLMRYEDWTFREAEVRLREHSELRAVLRLSSVPDYTTLYRFLRRLPDDAIENVLGESVRRLRLGRRPGPVSAAVDGTGLAPQAVSTYFLRRVEEHSGGKLRYKHYLKWLVIADVRQQILLAQRARQGPWIDTRALPGLVDAAAQRVPLGLVLADAEFDSEANHQHIRQRWGGNNLSSFFNRYGEGYLAPVTLQGLSRLRIHLVRRSITSVLLIVAMATSASACVAGWCSQLETSCRPAGVRKACAREKPACGPLIKSLPGKCGLRSFLQFHFAAFFTFEISTPFRCASSTISVPSDSVIIASSIGTPETDRGPPCA